MFTAFKRKNNVRSDDFNRPDSPTLGINWSLLPQWPSDDAELQIVSGRCRSVSGNSRGDMWRNDFAAPLVNQFAEVTIASWTGTVNRLGAVLLREASEADSCYEFSVIHDPAFDRAVIAKVDNGTYHELGNVTYVASVGDRIRAEVTDTNPPHLVHRVNGVIKLQLDDDNPGLNGPALTSGYPGIATIVLGGGPNSDAELDDWIGGQL